MWQRVLWDFLPLQHGLLITSISPSGLPSIPLVADNPITSLRAAGPGGGPFEVDFPYGSQEDWKNVFDQLIDSGMKYHCMSRDVVKLEDAGFLQIYD